MQRQNRTKRPVRKNKTSRLTHQVTFGDIVKDRSFRPPGVNSLKPGIGFPDKLNCLLRYTEAGVFTGSATPAAQVFNANSLFDPNSTGTGHQPSYFDIMNQVYTRYYVRAVAARVTIANENNVINLYAVCAYSDNDSSGQTVNTISESRYAKTGTVGLSTGESILELDMPLISIAQIMGEPKRSTEVDSNMYSSVGSSPSDLAFCYFKVVASDSSTSFTARWKMEILYDCSFKDVNPSYLS